ncbi:hypothetical protein M8J77_014786 [Diaphorina citri]|nr:hypothetical protein M8J77_014786 [Diaphorina citri]
MNTEPLVKTETSTPPVSALPPTMSLALPKFFKGDPVTYFVIVESQFTVANILSDEQKFTQLTARLDPEILAEVADVIRNPATRNYPALKEALTKRFTQSEEERLSKLLGHMEVGDRSPGQLLRDIQNLAGAEVPENLIRGLWLKKLPALTQQMLQALSTSLSLQQQADIADKMHSVQPSPTVSAVSPSPSAGPSQDPLTLLTQQVAQLTMTLEKFMTGQQGGSRSRSNTRSQTPSTKRYCRIHYKYREKARKCQEPSTFQFNSDHKPENAKPSLN